MAGTQQIKPYSSIPTKNMSHKYSVSSQTSTIHSIRSLLRSSLKPRRARALQASMPRVGPLISAAPIKSKLTSRCKSRPTELRAHKVKGRTVTHIELYTCLPAEKIEQILPLVRYFYHHFSRVLKKKH